MAIFKWGTSFLKAKGKKTEKESRNTEGYAAIRNFKKITEYPHPKKI